MRAVGIAILISLAGFSVQAQTKGAKSTPAKKPRASKSMAKPVVFKNNLDSASYALGLNVANNFKSGGLNTINYELFNKGLRDVFAKANPALSPEKSQETISKLFMSFNKQREAEEIKKYQPNVKAGEAFLAANKTKPGVKTTASGLQYEVLVQGTGAKPTVNDRVTVNYKGTLTNGSQFDSSYDRGTPATFGLTQVIAGWTEGLQLMQEGSKFRFVIPYQLGYGSRATPDDKIPPFSTLVFEVELIKVEAQ
jgi:FKBP-type peptidyl-prolyl cis-trans isomerase